MTFPLVVTGILALALTSCVSEEMAVENDFQTVDVTFPKEEKKLHVLPEADGSLRFKFCSVTEAFDKCPVLSDCAYPLGDLVGEVDKIKDADLRTEYLEDMLNRSYHTRFESKKFVGPLCRLLARVRKDKECTPKNECERYLKP